MNWLFFVIIGVLLAFGYYGYRRGVIRMAYTVISFVAAILATILLTPYIVSVLQNYEPARARIRDPISQTIEKKLEDGIQLDSILKDQYILPDQIATQINDYAAEKSEQQYHAIAEQTGDYVAEYMLGIAAYVLVFLIIRVALFVVGRLLRIVEKLPVLGTMNRYLGLALGVVEAVGCIWIFFLIVEISRTNEFGMTMLEQIHGNSFVYSLYTNNWFRMFF